MKHEPSLKACDIPKVCIKVHGQADLKFAKVAKLHLETKNGPILLHKTNHFQINEHDTRKVSLMIRAIIAGKNCRDKENHSFSLYLWDIFLLSGFNFTTIT